MAQPKPKMVWDDAAHLRLLLTIIAQHDITPNYKAVAAAFGNGVNQNILAQRMCALRKRAYAITGDATPGSSPKKGRGGRPRKASVGTATAGKQIKAVKNDPDEVDDDDKEGEEPFLVQEEGLGNELTAPPVTPTRGPRKAMPITPTTAPASGKGKITPAAKITTGRTDMVASGRIQKPRASPRKSKPTATCNENTFYGDVDLREEEGEITGADVAKGDGEEQGEPAERNKPFDEEYSESEVDEYVPEEE